MRSVLSRLLIAAGLAVALTACGGGGQQIAPGVTAVSADTRPGPGEVKFGLRNPDPEKWDARVRQATQTGGVRYGFTCKVLVCPEPATVIVSNSLSRSARPSEADLDKIAKETLPKLIQAQNLQFQVASDNKGKIEQLSSARTKFQGYNAVLNEIKTSVGERARYRAFTVIIAGRMLVTVTAEAGDRATARKSIDEFANNFTVEEGPPL
jgi:hypothetical protein